MSCDSAVFFAAARMRRVAIFALAAALLAACGSDFGSKKPDATPNPNVMPASYRSDILSTVHRMLDDPTGIRDASIAEPALVQTGVETRYIVCLRYNAKNSEGGYSGLKDRAAYFYSGQLNAIVDASREQCGKAAYQPFPELEKLCRELVCPKR